MYSLDIEGNALGAWRTSSLRVNTDLVHSGPNVGAVSIPQSLHSLLDGQDYELMGGYKFGRSLQVSMSSTTTCDDAALCGDAADVCDEALCGDGSDGACEAALCGADNCDAALCGAEFPEDECDEGLCEISFPSCVNRAQCPNEPTTCAAAQLFFATGGCAASCTNADFVSVVGTLVPLYPALAGCTRQAPTIVTTAFTASGDVSDFTPSKKDGIKTVFATAAGVDPSVVTVTVTSASVLITVAIAFSSPAAATTAVSTLSTGILANQGSLAAALQAAVPSIVVQAVVTAPVITSGPGTSTSGPGTAIAPLTSPSAGLSGGGIAGIVIAIAVVVLGLITYLFCKRSYGGVASGSLGPKFHPGGRTSSDGSPGKTVISTSNGSAYTTNSPGGSVHAGQSGLPPAPIFQAPPAPADPVEVVVEALPEATVEETKVAPVPEPVPEPVPAPAPATTSQRGSGFFSF